MSRDAGELGPSADQGLSAVTAHALSSGGTLYENGNEVRDVRINAIRVTVQVQRTHAALEFTVGSAALGQTIRILSRVVRHPTFGELSASRGQVTLAGPPSGIGAAGDRVVYDLLFGKDDPRALPKSVWERQVQQFGEARVRSFHEQHYRPETSALVVVGDVSLAGVVKSAEQWFADWQPRAAAAPRPRPSSSTPPKVERGIYLIRHPGDESIIGTAHRTVPFGHPDYWPLVLLANALTGSSSSRAYMSLRHATGLSYTVNAETHTSAADGVFVAVAASGRTDVKDVVSRLELELDRLAQQPVAGEELAQSKLTLLRRLRGDVGSNMHIARLLTGFFAFGDPIEVLATAVARISSVTSEDLARIARTHLGADSRVVLVFGNFGIGERPVAGLRGLRVWQGKD